MKIRSKNKRKQNWHRGHFSPSSALPSPSNSQNTTGERSEADMANCNSKEEVDFKTTIWHRFFCSLFNFSQNRLHQHWLEEQHDFSDIGNNGVHSCAEQKLPFLGDSLLRCFLGTCVECTCSWSCCSVACQSVNCILSFNMASSISCASLARTASPTNCWSANPGLKRAKIVVFNGKLFFHKMWLTMNRETISAFDSHAHHKKLAMSFYMEYVMLRFL